MKKIFFTPVTCFTFLLFLLFSNNAFSQDDIIMLNNAVVKAKVEEVGVNTIKYRKADNMDGPMYDMPKGDVYMIVYANGQSDIINARGGDASQGGTASQSDDVSAPIKVAPPEMPVYEQPACPTEGYLWTPGYWAYGFAGYYWVPGVWVGPPHPNYLWTPCYWGFVNGVYMYHEGYWGDHIGFYGGVNYGFGYGGHGYDGGRWEGGAFRYNTAVSHVNITVIHTTYEDRTVIHAGGGHASFNGEGGIRAEATPEERRVASENHVRPTAEQQHHVESARSDKGQYASNNGGKPAVTGMNKPGGQHFGSEGHLATPQPNSQPQAHPAQTSQHTNTNNAAPAQHTNTAPTQHTNTNNAAPAQHTNTAPTQHTSTGGQQQQQRPAGNTQQQKNKVNTAKPAPKPAPKMQEKK